MAFGEGLTVMGIDEAGRGPLAGPVFAAAVSVPLDRAAALIANEWKAVNDSKKLSPARRDALAATIRETPGCMFAVASASALEIDRSNILRATHLAMRRAALSLAEALDVRRTTSGSQPAPSARRQAQGIRFRILVDGLSVPSLPFPSQNLVKGDAKSLFIAAASILAKTARDAYCMEMEARFPGYGFAVHKGYPTPAHIAALERLGPCPEHRQSFGPVAEAMFFRGGA
ncbi:MAG: ribonuclease HII [Kiritimatiellae bacterium]|nr:ribonuclease HII [Kiritimatiellia bacterium]